MGGCAPEHYRPLFLGSVYYFSKGGRAASISLCDGSRVQRNRGTWKLLNYLDPSFDVRVARDTYVGVGVSHRSGEFGKSELYGNVNGGSNYIYVSIETAF